MESWAKELYGSEEAAFPTSYEKKAVMNWDHEIRHIVIDILGLCKWHIPWFITPSLDLPAMLFSAFTGVETSEEELMATARRVRTLERAFNVMKGVRRRDDTLPERLFKTSAPGGFYKGETLDKEKFDGMLDEYYTLHEWDKKTSWPTRETLEKLDLKYIADYLEEIGKLP